VPTSCAARPSKWDAPPPLNRPKRNCSSGSAKESIRLADARHQWLRHWEKAAVELAMKVAERIVRREVAASPAVAIGLVREALEMAAGSPRIRICLNPADRDALGDEAQRLTKEIARTADTQIVSDPSISRGGCRVETQHGVIDQRIETQLDRIAEELLAGA
jgi:flagellar assembly protein FliH